MRARVIPGATYRLQLNSAFTFADAERIVPYLRRLGATHCYLSPYLKARPGSTHGYDVIDHSAVNGEIGTRADLDSLAAALAAAGMGQIVDVVPNHMGVMGADNAWWLDVLENGQTSPYADYFDIDWHPVRPELRDKVLVPVLGDHYGTVLERGELELAFDAEAGALAVQYFEHKLPLDPASYVDVLGGDGGALGAHLGREDPDLAEYLSILHAFESLPPHRETGAARKEERMREKEVGKRRLAELCARSAPVREHVATQVAALASAPADPASLRRLHALLERQAWRVAYWQVAADEINYRRFFDINELAALRMDRPGVLRATHGLIADLYRAGVIDGVRIDHPDGLYDPAAYFERLQELLAGDDGDAPGGDSDAPGGDSDAPGGAIAAASAPAAHGSATPPRSYVVAEKILAAHEYLREDWAVDGTTGYDFVFLATGLTVYADAEREIERGYRAFTREHVDFGELLYECKKLIVRVHLSSERTMLANLLNRLAQTDWRTRDFTLNGIRDALTEIVACFPVYRTYVTPRGVDGEDRRYVDWAVSWARRRDPGTNPDLYDFVRNALLLELPAHWSAEQRALCERFAMKFQQYTAPVMAKALEDTSFYRYARLLSLNDVGGDPSRFGVSVAAFHHQNRARQRRWPHNLLAGSTHDNKRSEDARARLNVLTEIPAEWRTRIRRWRRLTRALRRKVATEEAPTRRDEYIFYQSLFGVWPLEPPDAAALAELADRLAAYMQKAAREAKEHTSWMRPDEVYEGALERFVRAALDPGEDRLRADVTELVSRIAPFGLLNSLTQTALRLTAPGVPDVYQGDEVWSFNLVDPDNRRPVDYAHRAALLADLERRAETEPLESIAADLMNHLHDGRAKLYVIWRVLQLRAAHRALFDHGEYVPLAVGGARADHVCAFMRRHDATTAIVVAGRWFARLRAETYEDGARLTAEAWGDTWVELAEPVTDLRNVLNGATPAPARVEQRLSVGALLAPLPVALLVGQRAA